MDVSKFTLLSSTYDSSYTGNYGGIIVDPVNNRIVYSCSRSLYSKSVVDNGSSVTLGTHTLILELPSLSSTIYGLTTCNEGKTIIISTSTNRLYQYNTSTPYDYANLSYVRYNSISTSRSWGLNYDGTNLYIGDYNDSEVYKYSIPTNGDVSQLTYIDILDCSTQYSAIACAYVDIDNNVVYANGQSKNVIYKYSLDSDFSECSYLNSTSLPKDAYQFAILGDKVFTLDGYAKLLNIYKDASLSSPPYRIGAKPVDETKFIPYIINS